MLRELNYTNHA